jgi:alpha-beta hydrolase superfamily lysophospholipase
VHAIGNRKPRHVVVVAQSMGGFTAALVCQQVPVALLVLVNAMILAAGPVRQQSSAHRRSLSADPFSVAASR